MHSNTSCYSRGEAGSSGQGERVWLLEIQAAAWFWGSIRETTGLPALRDCYYFSVTQSCPTLCDPMDCSMPCFPVLHHLLEFAQTHVH